MKNNIKNILSAAAMILLLFASCAKKEENLKQTFYGKVTVETAQVPANTPTLEVRYNDRLLGDAPLNYPGVQLEAGGSGKLAVYIKGTDQKIADTTISVKKNATSSFRIAYIPELNLTGWLNTKPVDQDSTSIVIFNKMGDFFTTHPSTDLYIFYTDFTTLQMKETGIVIRNFEKTTLLPAIVLPYWYDKSNQQRWAYYGKIKDNATGEFIRFTFKNRDYFGLNYEPGATMLNTLTVNNGAITVGNIML